jgi:sugar lactone lactonase YvrE
MRRSSSRAIATVVREAAIIGEGPVWDDRLGRLLWLDIAQGLVHVTDPSTGVDRAIVVGQPVGAIAPSVDGTYVAAVRDGFGRLDVGAGTFELVAAVEGGDRSTRMNDGKVDPAGRFWAGTMALDERPGAGSLYRFDPDGSVTRHLTGLTISNGLDWTADGHTMYFVDSPTQRVDAITFDAMPGTLGERRPFATIDASLGVPDGLTVDAEDHVWVAVWGGWCVLHLDPSGREVERLPVPAAQPSSVAFGGPDLRDLFITTATDGLQIPDPTQPDAGSLFVCRPGPQGRSPRRFRWAVARETLPRTRTI